MEAELILIHGKIYTVDESRPWAQALAVKDGRIVAVGDNEAIVPLAGPATRWVNAGNRLVLPGLADAHIHFYDWSLARRQIWLASCANKAEMLAHIKAAAATAPAEAWLVGRGWNETGWDDPALPQKGDLDPVTGSDRPAIFWRTDMHAAVANSAALQLAGIDGQTDDPPGGVIGRDEAGQPNGLLWELAINLLVQIMPVAEIDERVAVLAEGMAELHRLGVTAVHDQRMKDQPEGPPALEAYQAMRRVGRLDLRVSCNLAAHDLDRLAAGELKIEGDDTLRLGHIKLFTDGSMGSRTAWMLRPFEPGPGRPDLGTGVNVTPPQQMAAEIRRAADLGYPVSIHAIGDRANREILDILEEITQTGPRPAVPHRIEHVQIIDPADIPRLGAAGITASVQPVHALDDRDMAEAVLGRRVKRVYNFRSLAEHGALLALGSDAPVADPNPFLGIHAAVCRQRPEDMALGPWYGDERLNLAQALFGYTLGAAQAAGWQEAIGSITPGKRADMIVIDRDLFDLVEAGVSGGEIAETQVLMTIFDGRVVFDIMS